MNPTKKVKNLERIKDIKVTGFLKDPYKILEKSKLVIIPLRFGAGIQNKVLEAMALGKAVVTTEIGARGISGIKNGEQLLITDFKKPKETDERIIDLLRDGQAQKRIGENAREFILKNYTWKNVGDSLLANIAEII